MNKEKIITSLNKLIKECGKDEQKTKYVSSNGAELLLSMRSSILGSNGGASLLLIKVERVIKVQIAESIQDEEVYMKKLLERGRFVIPDTVIPLSTTAIKVKNKAGLSKNSEDVCPTNRLIEFFSDLEVKGYEEIARQIDKDLDTGIYPDIAKEN